MTARGRTLWTVGLASVACALLAPAHACAPDEPTALDDAPQPSAPGPDPATRPKRRVRAVPPPLPAPPAVTEPSAPEPQASGYGEVAAEPKPRAPHTLIVTARDAGGIAAADADVEVRGPSVTLGGGGSFDGGGGAAGWARDWPSSKPLATGKTDTGGVARVSFGRFDRVRVRVASDDRVATLDSVALAEGDTTEVAVTVVPAFRLSGVVRRPDGQPVAGAAVFLGWLSEPGRPNRIDMVHAGPDGQFSFPSAAVPNAPVLRVYAMGDNEPGACVDLPTRGGRIENVVVTLEAATVVTGRCVDEAGRPLGHVRVRGIFPMTGEITYTDANGHFSMKVPASGGGLVFWVEGRVQSGLRDLRGIDGKLSVGDVLIPRGGVLAGRVRTADGTPAAGAELLISDPVTWHAAHRATLGPDGRFRSDLIGAGNHAILIRTGLPGGKIGFPCWFVSRGHLAGTTGIEITVPQGIWGRVTVLDGADAEVELGDAVLKMRPAGDPGYVVHDQQFAQDAVGGFDLQFPAPGRYVVTIELRSKGEVVETELTVSEAGDQVFEVRAR